MASSGTFGAFAPSIAELGIQAFERAGVRRTALTLDHMVNLRMETNLLLAEWSNKQVNLFNVDQETVTLAAGTPTYDISAGTAALLDVYISTTSNGLTTDRIIMPVSRSEYVAFPDKTTAGTPTVYWFNRQVAPTVTLWQPPDASIVALSATLKYYRVTQVEDANLPGGETPGVPQRFYDALVAGIAHRLARIYKPEFEMARKADAMEAWSIAAAHDTEHEAIYIAPGFGGYYR